jgi:hypothetical protein
VETQLLSQLKKKLWKWKELMALLPKGRLVVAKRPIPITFV